MSNTTPKKEPAPELEVVKTDIGPAEDMTMDEFVRTTVGQMFKNDNNRATLVVVLNGTGADVPPEIELELNLLSINGQPTRRQ